MSDIRRLLFEMEEHPEDFECGDFKFKHKPSGHEIWIANGFWFYGLKSPRDISFSLADKFRFGVAFFKWSMNQPAESVSGRRWLRQHVCKKNPS